MYKNQKNSSIIVLESPVKRCDRCNKVITREMELTMFYVWRLQDKTERHFCDICFSSMILSEDQFNLVVGKEEFEGDQDF